MCESYCQHKRRTETVRLLCKQACKPGSVIEDSHLSWRIVAGTLQPPPENGRAGHVFSHGVAPDRVYSDELFPVIGRALISAFPPLPRRHKLPILRSAASGRAHSFRCASSPHKSIRFCGGPFWGTRRYISVALFLGSPPAGVTRYPCPVEPGLSSPAGLSPCERGCPAYLRCLFYIKRTPLSNSIEKGKRLRYNKQAKNRKKGASCV